MFLQIGKRYTPFSALSQFFPTLPIIYAQVHYPSGNTIFDPPYFSPDNTFKH
jgi:hypothetical protein